MSVPLSVRQFAGAGHVEQADLSNVRFSQVYLDEAKVDAMAKKGTDGMPDPVAAVVDGSYIVQDGHHRTSADIKSGRKKIGLRVF